MTLTRHGHHIPGSPEDPIEGRMVARCGGVFFCKICIEDTLVWKLENGPKTSVEEPEELTFNQELRKLVNKHNVDARMDMPDFVIALLIENFLDGVRNANQASNKWKGL